MKRQYEIFAGSHRVEITATSAEAKAYACGMRDALRMAGQPTKVQVYNIETGNLFFEAANY